MRVFILFAHPFESSFNAAIHIRLVQTLRSKGHEVDDCDLNAEGFDPVLSRQEWVDYHNVGVNDANVRPYVDRLLAAEALILSYPVWNMGFPAILKGFLDRVFLPGVSFEIGADGSFAPKLHNIRRLGAVCTYGSGSWASLYLGDPPRHVVKRTLAALCARRAPCDYLALYDMNRSKPEQRVAFLKKVEAAFGKW